MAYARQTVKKSVRKTKANKEPAKRRKTNSGKGRKA